MTPTPVLVIKKTDGTKTVTPFGSVEEAVNAAREVGFSGNGHMPTARLDNSRPDIVAAWVTQTLDIVAFANRL